MADGSGALALTCSTCHEKRGAGGALEPGLPNAALDIGAALIAAHGGSGAPDGGDPVAAWGPGRLDVTTSAGTEPVRISDLRPVKWLTYLHVRSLATGLPSPADAARASPRGETVFASTCGGCHVPDGLTGDPVALVAIGTDPTLGMSADRGTGKYRVPSLHGVGTRGPLLHDATVPSVAAMFDPARPTAAYASRLHGAGAAQGHLFGLGLADADRTALVEYVSGL
jgi:hypothetical protein